MLCCWAPHTFFTILQGSDLVLQDCDINSSTGSGVGIEGGSPLLARCTVHNCERHGVAVFSELGGSAGVVCLMDTVGSVWTGSGVPVPIYHTINPHKFRAVPSVVQQPLIKAASWTQVEVAFRTAAYQQTG